MRDQLRVSGVRDTAVDDAVLILSELLTNACRHGRPLPSAPPGTAVPSDGEGDGDGDVLAAWRVDAAGRLTVEVTDGGGPTRPVPAKPSVTARGGRGLSIITALADDWGVRDGNQGGVTVWVVVSLETASDEPTAPRAPAGPNGFDGSAGQGQTGGLAASGRSNATAGTTVKNSTGTGTGTGTGDGSAGAQRRAPTAGSGNPLGSGTHGGNAHGHRAPGGGAAHAHRPGLGQSHRHGTERAARLTSRPMSALQDRDYPVAYDDQD